MISIKNFVSANIEVETAPKVFSGFRTTVYFAPVTIDVPAVANGNFIIATSIDDFDNKVNQPTQVVRESVQEYFKNGGTSLCVVNPTVFTLEGFKADIKNVSRVVDDFIFVVIANSLIGTAGGYPQGEVFNIANFCSGNGWSDDDLKSLNTMRACFTTNLSTFVLPTPQGYGLANTLSVIKYSTYQAPSGGLIDAALLVGAYYSQIDTSEADSILDYNFTPEHLGSDYFEDLSQEEFTNLIRNPANGYYNVICNVANKILNIGGDYCNGVSISLDFGAACIERDLNYANIELLFGKLPLTSVGQAKLIDAINSQLTKYVDNEFLEQDATYTGETKKVTYNGTSYTIIRKGDVLSRGYKVFYVPINAISAADKSAKRFPYIYVALQSVHGARLIEVNGSIL